MRIKRARQIVKAFSDDTRMRIVNLLNKEELSVTQICRTLNKNQSIISKHLTRLRLTGILADRREGINVYYYLAESRDNTCEKLIRAIREGLSGIETFKEDSERLKALKKPRRKGA